MVTTQIITLIEDGSRTFDAYLARPEHSKAPSIMIFTEMFGIGQHNRDMAEDYARRGFNALIPNLFWRSAFPGELAFEGPDRDAAWARLAALDIDGQRHTDDAGDGTHRGEELLDRQRITIGISAGPCKPSAGRSNRLGAPALDQSGASRIPGIRQDEKLAIVKPPKELIQHHRGSFSKVQACQCARSS